MAYQIGALETVIPQTEEPLSAAQVLETKGIPWLTVDPKSVFNQWQHRMQAVMEHVRQMKINCSRWAKDAPKPTQLRLKALGQAEEARLQLLEKICGLYGWDVSAPAAVSTVGSSTVTEQGILNYFDHIVRDWSWGEGEINAQVKLISGLIRGKSGGTVVVVGSGAGRLSYELRKQNVFAEVIALDINPLLLMLSKILSEGQVLSVPEFPPAPISAEESAVIHKCKAPEKVTGLHFGIADAYDLPFANDSVDFILTPFLVDILPMHFEYLAQEMNRCLKSGGQWLSVGTLAFHRGDIRQQLLKNEVRDALNFHGFKIKNEKEERMPFVSSPESRQTRTELLDAWVVEKVGETKPVREHVDEIATKIEAPASSVNRTKPLTLSPALQEKRVQAEIHFWVLSQIDGKTSVNEIIARLSQQTGLPQAAAEDAVLSFFKQHLSGLN